MFRTLLLAALLAGCASAPAPTRTQPPLKASSQRSAPCPEGLELLESGSCLALPADADAETPLLVYLHGMTDSPGMARISAGILGRASIDHGLAMLAPLGAQGNCNWDPEVADAWCWPTGADQGEAVDRFLRELDAELHSVQLRLGRSSPIRPILVGYSNGGFMAMNLIGRSTEPYSSLVVLHAGARPTFAFPRSPPLRTLLRAASGDEWHFRTMEALREALREQGWDTVWSVREGEHRFTESDAAAIVEFLGR